MSWLKDAHEELAQAITDRCLEGYLSVRGGRGVTFIVPGADDMKKIVAGAYSSDKAKVEEAETLIKMHIVQSCMELGKDFKPASGDIGSVGGSILTASEVGEKTATLKGGAKVQRVDAQILREGAAVWKVTSGSLPSKDDGWKPARRGGRVQGGGSFVGGGPLSREAFTNQLLDHFKTHALSGSPDAKAEAFRVFHAAVSCLLRHMKTCAASDANAEAKLALATAISILDRNPIVNWALIVEPFRTGGDMLLPQSVWDSWDQATGSGQKGAKTTAKFFSDPQAAVSQIYPEAASAAIFSQPGRVQTAIEACREEVMGQAVSASPISYMEKAYASTLAKNQIGAVSDVWPKGVAAKLGEGRKLWQDLLRGKVKACFIDAPISEACECACRLVSETLRGKDFCAEFREVGGGEGGVAPRGNIFDCLSKNVSCTDFLYAPQSTEMINSVPSRSVGVDPLNTRLILNTDLQANAHLESAAAEQPAANSDWIGA